VNGELTVTVLGCDGSYPGPGGATSGYLITCDGTRVWMDAGTGTLANLQRHIAIEDVDAVVISHEHPDHWTDLDHFAVASKWMIGRTGVPVYAPSGVRELTRAGSASDVLEWHLIAPDRRITLGPLELSFSRTDHPVPTMAIRVDGQGRSLGYSADSGPGWGLESLGPGLHLALCEATFLSDKEGSVQHLSGRQAGLTARRAGVERLVITHVAPRVDHQAVRREAEQAFGAEVTVATIGAQYRA
jgi:ribonuclease BN (tRNA processing enzyme)